MPHYTYKKFFELNIFILMAMSERFVKRFPYSKDHIEFNLCT